jgi:hypothetical protein
MTEEVEADAVDYIEWLLEEQAAGNLTNLKWHFEPPKGDDVVGHVEISFNPKKPISYITLNFVAQKPHPAGLEDEFLKSF